MPETTDALPPSLNPRGRSRSTTPPPARHHHAAPGGLAPTTAVVLHLVVSLGFAVGAAMNGHAYSQVFQAAFLLVSVYVALRIRVADRFVAMVTPPLVYVLATFLSSLLNSESQVHTVKRGLEDTVLQASLNAPWLIAASVLAVLICLVRGRRADKS